MNKFLILLLWGFFGTNEILGQVHKNVLKELTTKDFIRFKIYADRLDLREKNTESNWQYIRDLTYDFQEAIFFFEYYAPDSATSTVNKLRMFRVNILATKTQIAFYELSEQNIIPEDSTGRIRYEVIEKYSNKSLMDSLKKSFLTIFHVTLNETELFINHVVWYFRNPT
jgi:hypothetical protein